MSAPPQVPRRTITQFCDHVCQYVRFHPDHEAIRAELAAHMEDHAAALMERGVPEEEATKQAVAAICWGGSISASAGSRGLPSTSPW